MPLSRKVRTIRQTAGKTHGARTAMILLRISGYLSLLDMASSYKWVPQEVPRDGTPDHELGNRRHGYLQILSPFRGFLTSRILVSACPYQRKRRRIPCLFLIPCANGKYDEARKRLTEAPERRNICRTKAETVIYRGRGSVAKLFISLYTHTCLPTCPHTTYLQATYLHAHATRKHLPAHLHNIYLHLARHTQETRNPIYP